MYSIVIPARYDSSRLPGKPLALIAGKPMIQHVYERAMASSAQEVLVATDDQRVLDAVTDFGGQAVLTSSEHPSGTDRLNEVAEIRGYSDAHIVVNLQGDEPLLPVDVIEQVANNIAQSELAGIATLCEKITSVDELLDPNAVKVVRDAQDMALYFSRAPIPFVRDAAVTTPADATKTSTHTGATNISLARDTLQQLLDAGFAAPAGPQWFRHIGLYAYRASVLREFVGWPVAPCEQSEKLEQLRALYNGVRIHCAEAVAPVPAGVDTPEDLARMQSVFSRGH